MAPKTTSKTKDKDARELIDTGTSKRSVRRAPNGRFTTDQVIVGKSSRPRGRKKS